ncbi:MAG: selenocysteine lyase/cysteine desulfurase [Pseudohongiellaceae bacterium]|jgi:selenocysteine lyase/cysteine desulfurase
MRAELISKIRESVIGERQLIPTSFGMKPLIYADYTASGRSLAFIEDFISTKVLPFYANTHTETSFSGAQTTAYREQARGTIRSAVNGNNDDQVIFCGAGATAAINKLIDILNLRLPAELSEKYHLLDQLPADSRPVVFIGPYEHHSNEIPWRESIADVVVIPLTDAGKLDDSKLEEELIKYNQRPLKIGSFSAASNVTGIKTDVDKVASLLHSYGAVSFWDYAAAAPYVGINMNPEDSSCTKDAVFLSPHKFVGGPGTPGILIVKKQLLKNKVPAMPGGGTVLYVTPEDHQFIENHERREEGGTPAIVESIRAGLVFQLQQEVGTDNIEELEHSFKQRALARWRQHSNIEILGNTDVESLSIFSLRLKHGDMDLHYGFVVALLNDLFGIQARGGCSCAGPYGHDLLGMDMKYSRALEAQLNKGHMVLRPGWVRLNFNYFIDESTFEYLVSAVELVANYGWRLLPYYQFDGDSGTWRFQGQKMQLNSSLCVGDLLGSSNTPEFAEPDQLDAFSSLAIDELQKTCRSDIQYSMELPEQVNKLRWFVLPQEVSSDPVLEMAS